MFGPEEVMAIVWFSWESWYFSCENIASCSKESLYSVKASVATKEKDFSLSSARWSLIGYWKSEFQDRSTSDVGIIEQYHFYSFKTFLL